MESIMISHAMMMILDDDDDKTPSTLLFWCSTHTKQICLKGEWWIDDFIGLHMKIFGLISTTMTILYRLVITQDIRAMFMAECIRIGSTVNCLISISFSSFPSAAAVVRSVVVCWNWSWVMLRVDWWLTTFQLFSLSRDVDLLRALWFSAIQPIFVFKFHTFQWFTSTSMLLKLHRFSIYSFSLDLTKSGVLGITETSLQGLVNIKFTFTNFSEFHIAQRDARSYKTFTYAQRTLLILFPWT